MASTTSNTMQIAYNASDLTADITLDNNAYYENSDQSTTYDMAWGGQLLSNWSIDLNKDDNDAVAFKTIGTDFYYIVYGDLNDNSTHESYKNGVEFDGFIPNTVNFDAGQNEIQDSIAQYFKMMGMTNFEDDLLVSVSFDEATDIDTFDIRINQFTFNSVVDTVGVNVHLEFNDNDQLTANSTGLDASNLIAIGINAAGLEQWYKYADPDNFEVYEIEAVEKLFELAKVESYTDLKVDAQDIVNGEEFTISVGGFDYDGNAVYAPNDLILTFVNGTFEISQSSIPTEYSGAINATVLNLWYEKSNPDRQQEQDQRDDGYLDNDKSGGNAGKTYDVGSYSYKEYLPDGSAITWYVTEQEIDGAWSRNETSTQGDTRVFSNSWNHSTQENTSIEVFKNSDSTIDYTRTEVSGQQGTTITHTGTTDHIGWNPLDGIYTITKDVVEIVDINWNTLSITGQATNTDGDSVPLGWDANSWQLTVDGESVFNNMDNFDDFFKQGETSAYEWADWDGSIWKVVEEDVSGLWTTTETKYDSTGVTATGEVRKFSSSWDESTNTNTWTEENTRADGGTSTRVETQTTTGTTVQTVGAADHVGWMYLGKMYTNLDVVETMDSNWNTTDISGTGINENNQSVAFTWDSATWQLLADGNPIAGDAYDNGTDQSYDQPQDWASKAWTWQDGEGTTWTVTDKQEGDVWTSTEIADNGDSRISSSTWDNANQTNTWSETIIKATQNLNFTVSEIYNESDNKSQTITSTNLNIDGTQGGADRIGWMPLDGIYTQLSVTETRNSNWETTDITGSGIKDNGDGTSTTIAFGMQTTDWGFQITLDNGDGNGPQAYDPWAQGDTTGQTGNATDGNNDHSYSNTWSWQDDYMQIVWVVDEQDDNGTWTSTETGYALASFVDIDNPGTATGDVRKSTNSWDDANSTSSFIEKFKTADGKLDFVHTETFNADGTTTVVITGKDDHIGWDYLGESYTDMSVTLIRDVNWNTSSVIGNGKNADGDTVKFGYDDGQITVDGDSINSNQDYGDKTTSGDNFELTWDYYDDMGIKWTVTDSQDGEWWKSVETSDNGDVRVNKSMWNDGDDDNSGAIDGDEKGPYSKFVSKFKSGEVDINGNSDPLIKYKMVEEYYENYEGSSDQRTVIQVKGDTDMLGWDYLGEVYTDIDFEIVRDGNGIIKRISTSDDNAIDASATNADGVKVYFYKSDTNKHDIFISENADLSNGRSIYEMNDDFFDFGDGNSDKFKMDNDQWNYDFTDHQGNNVSVVDKKTETDIITITADSYNGGSDALKIAIVYDLDGDSVASVVGVPDNVTGLDKVSIEAWYKTNILNFTPSGGWDAADADAQEQQLVSDYFTSISLTTTSLDTVFDINDQWVTTETTKDDNDVVTNILVRTRSESIGTETEKEERYETDDASTAQAKFDAGNPSSWVERSNNFSDDADGGYSMVQAVTSSEGEDMIRTETYNEDGTTTITNIGDVWFEGMLVKNAEITEQLDQYWNIIDFSGRSDMPDEKLNEINAEANAAIENAGGSADANIITVDNTGVMISFDGLGNYGQPKLTFSIFATEDIVFMPGTADAITIYSKDQLFAKENNYTEQSYSMLNEYALVDGDSYSTSREDWVWNQDSFTAGDNTLVDADIVSTFTGVQSDKPSKTITITETKQVNSEGNITSLEHHIVTSKDEDHTIVFNEIDRADAKYNYREGVELLFDGSKKYLDELYKNVDVDKFIDMHSGDVLINGTADSLDGSSVEIFKPEGQRKLEIIKTGRDGKQQKLSEDDSAADKAEHYEVVVERSNEVYQWNYTDHNNIKWTVVDKYDGKTWSSTETGVHNNGSGGSAGEKSIVDTWAESGGLSVFTESLIDSSGVAQDVIVETRTFTSNYTSGVYEDIQTVVITKDAAEVGNYTETMTFNVDGTSSRVITGDKYHFNGQNYTEVDIKETRGDSWNIVSLSGTVKLNGDTVTVGYSGTNSWGDPILTFGGAVDASEIVNDNPVAIVDTFTLDENESKTIDVTSNDTDANSDILSVKSIGEAANGSVFLLNGDIAYTPNYNYSGLDSFTYVVTDGKGGNATGTVNIIVNTVNEDVTAVADSFTVEAGTLATVLDLTANDTDADGDTITVESVGSATRGIVSLDLGVVSYKPDEGFSGTDSFTYTINDGDSATSTTSTATATVIVEALNSAPTVFADTAIIDEDTSVQIDVLGNDKDDADTGKLSVDSVSDATNGSVKLMMGYVFYTPNTDYTGTDSFTYVAKDSEGAKTTGTVTLTVTARNDAPVATVDVVNIEQDSASLTIDVLSNDTDAESNTLSLLDVGSASKGKVAMDSGKVIYTPTAGETGFDTFTYVVGDLADDLTVQAKTIGTVNVTISETNADPITIDDVETVTEDSSNNKFSVLTNDTDPNGNTLTLDSISSALHGTATLAGNNILYHPDADYEGSDTIIYTVTDGNGGSTKGTVVVTIRGSNDAPEAVDDILGSVSTDKGPVKLDVLANDYDIDLGDSLSIKSVATSATSVDDTEFGATALTALGNRVSIANGKVTYTASSVSNGSDSFDYLVTDESGQLDYATATLTLSNNTNPDAVNDTQTIAEDASATEITVLSNDMDVDLDRVQIHKIGTDPSYGTAAVTNGKLFYTPNSNYTGTDTFTYIVKDGKSGFDEATATITITAVNDDPSARNDNATVETNTIESIIDVLGNDSDVDGDTLTVTAIGNSGASTKDGVVTLTSGVVTYTPKAGFTGSDSFTYTVSDDATTPATATATVNITVAAANTAPVANNVDYATAITEDAKDVSIDLSSEYADNVDTSDVVSIVSITQADHGTVKFTNGKILYTPDADYAGSDKFTYTVDDTNDGQDSGIVTLNVTNVADDAVAVNDDLGDILSSARRVKVDLLSNDTDADGDEIGIVDDGADVGITSVGNAKYGSVSLVNGEVYYTPGDTVGTDVFTYTLTGGDEGTAKVNVVAANSETTGSVVITGSAQTGQTLTVSNTLADADGMANSTLTYQWYRDGEVLQGETGTTYSIALEEAGSAFAVKASYTDDRGATESVTSESTDVVVQLDKPFSFISEVLTGTEASAVLALSGFSFNASDEIVKLTLNLDMDSITSPDLSNVISIAGADITIDFDWNNYSVLDGAGNSDVKFVLSKISENLIALNSSSTGINNIFNKLALASIRTDDPLLTIVDEIASNDSISSITNSANLMEVYLRPTDNSSKLEIDMSAVVSANQGQVTFNQYSSITSNINNVATNSDPVGSVTVSGSLSVDSTLSASNNITDADGMPSSGVDYQWLRDNVNIALETNDTYTLTTSDINKDITVKATYTDTGVTPTQETVTSLKQEIVQSTIDKPLMFVSELITASEASIEVYGADYSLNPNETIVRLTLNADMSSFSDSSIESIAGLELDFEITDWATQIDTIKFTGGHEKQYMIKQNYTGEIFSGLATDNDTGYIEKVVLSSLNTSSKPYLTLVDNLPTQPNEVEVTTQENLISIYLNPVDTIRDFDLVFSGEISIDQGQGIFNQSSYSLEVNTKTYDGLVSTMATTTQDQMMLTGDVTLDFSDIATTSISVDSGEISIDDVISWGTAGVSLSQAGAYNFDVTIADAIAVLSDVVDITNLTGNAFHAGDVNNSGSITIADAIAILSDVVDINNIDTFDIIDSNGDRISTLDASAQSSAPTWTLVANGDVNMSGSWNDEYIVASDLV